jgi:hypothetical protein
MPASRRTQRVEPDLWEQLRRPFEPEQIELLPKPYSKESPKRNCEICGGYHGMPAAHLHYVGHAGVTIRLNEADPAWNWEPLAMDERGLPLITKDGMWIRLTVLGKTVLAFGDAQGRTGPNAVKEIIGDAIRNGAMRLGVGTYLWSKSDAAKATLERQGLAPDETDAPTQPDKRVAEPILEDLRAARTALGVSDANYAKSLEERGVTIDTELTERQAAAMLAEITKRLKAKQDREAKAEQARHRAPQKPPAPPEAPAAAD